MLFRIFSDIIYICRYLSFFFFLVFFFFSFDHGVFTVKEGVWAAFYQGGNNLDRQSNFFFFLMENFLLLRSVFVRPRARACVCVLVCVCVPPGTHSKWQLDRGHWWSWLTAGRDSINQDSCTAAYRCTIHPLGLLQVSVACAGGVVCTNWIHPCIRNKTFNFGIQNKQTRKKNKPKINR